MFTFPINAYIYSVDEHGNLKEFKRHLYELLHMDNEAHSSVTSLIPHFDQLSPIFEKIGFKLQEFVKNDKTLKASWHIYWTHGDNYKLLGMIWDTVNDTLSPPKLKLNPVANSSRQILSSKASIYDMLNIDGSKLNRAHISMHELQCLPNSEVRNGITTQVENSKKMAIVKFMECDLNQLFWILVDSWMG